jgi:hypothetical protein
VLFWYGSGDTYTDFRIWIQLSSSVADKMPKKEVLFSRFFCIFTSVFMDQKTKRSHKIEEIKGFSYIFCLLMDPVPYKIMTDPEGPQTYGFGLLVM